MLLSLVNNTKIKVQILITYLLGFIHSLFSILKAFTFSAIFNAMFDGNRPKTFQAILLHLIVYVTMLFFYNFYLYYRKKVEYLILEIKREEAFKHLNHTASIKLEDLVYTFNQFESEYMENQFSLVKNIFSFIITLFSLVYIHYSLGLLATINILIVYIAPKIIPIPLKELNEKSLNQLNIFTKFYTNLSEGIFEIKNFQLFQKMSSKLKSHVSKYEESRYNLSNGQLNEVMFTSFISSIYDNMTLLIAFYLAYTGNIQLGSIIAILDLNNRIINYSQTFTYLQSSLKASVPYKEKIEKMIHSALEDTKIIHVNRSIELKDISLKYDDKEIFHCLNLKFEKDKKYLLNGPSGVGKTTIVSLIRNFQTPNSGSTLLDSQAQQNYQIENLAIINQNSYLFNDTIQNNILLGQETLNPEILEISGLNDFIKQNKISLDTMIINNGQNISAGQKQCILIARTLAKGKDIIIIDEGLSALKNELAKKVQSNLFKLPNKTFLFIEHHPILLESFDEVIYLKGGC